MHERLIKKSVKVVKAKSAKVQKCRVRARAYAREEGFHSYLQVMQ